jgi:hypothetical protein
VAAKIGDSTQTVLGKFMKRKKGESRKSSKE